ncbi:MAG: discoidin domain-containing protein [Verrucomicrobia bacterium]|nr:discoidin domain-containing protein [Verrucomicrobiota bacterium]
MRINKTSILAVLVTAGLVWTSGSTMAAESNGGDKEKKTGVKGDAGQELAPIKIELPMPVFTGTPMDIPTGAEMEEPREGPRPDFMAPVGTKNVAFEKEVTSSDMHPVFGTLDQVTDGDKEAYDTSYVELKKDPQWVQVDLGDKRKIYAIVMWHSHNVPQVAKDVIVQVSNDPDFGEGVKTLFNNDQDNSSGLGIGKDLGYFETYEGKLVDAKGVEARYVRCWSNGSTYTALNRWTEIEVYGKPVE